MLFKVEKFEGINNVDDDKRVNKITFTRDGNVVLSGDLKSCSNYRIPKDRVIAVRNGFTKKVTLTDGHSYWANPSGNLALLVDGTTLKKVATDYTTTNIKTGLTAGKDMRYAEHNNVIFMGNTAEMLKYDYLGDSPSVTTWEDTTNLSEEFEYPQLTYRPPPISNILISYYARMYVAEGRFLLYSDPIRPETFRMAHNIPCAEDITAVSRDLGHLYVHTLNTTKVLIGRDPSDWYEVEYAIGAIKQRIISPPEFNVPFPIFKTKRGWAKAEGGVISYLDHENFRLDLPSSAIGYTGYDEINREVVCTIRQ